MANDTVLVTGIHREELGFGDHVAALVNRGRVDIMRIPKGIPRAKTDPGKRFYSAAQHREIYLQVLQQVKGRYRLMIDLHRGLDEAGRCADVFCHDETFLQCLCPKLRELPNDGNVNLVRIIASNKRIARPDTASVADAQARTWIPPRIWLCTWPLYVGLEVYLTTDSDGQENDWAFAHLLIGTLLACAPHGSLAAE